MSVYRFTVFSTYQSMGFSEVYWTRDASISSAQTLLQQLMTQRAAVMPSDQSFAGVRAAIEGPTRQSALLIPPGPTFPGTDNVIPLPTAGTLTLAPTGRPPTLGFVAANYQISFNTGRKAIRYLATVPSQFVTTEPGGYGIGADPSYVKALGQWFDFLASGSWQVKALDLSAATGPYPVVGVTVQAAAPSEIGIMLATNVTPTPAFTMGQRILLRGFRPAKGTRGPTLNGSWMVDSINTTLTTNVMIVYLRGSAGIDPSAQRYTPKTFARAYSQTFFGIQQASLIRVRTHRRGRPTLSPRGRRLSRPSLDP